MDNRKWESGAAGTPPAAPAALSAGYPTNGDPLIPVPPTLPGAFWFHQMGEELRAVLTAAGLTPSTASTSQLLEAIQRLIDAQSGNYALDTGAAGAYVVALSPAITAYTDGLTVRVKAVNANAGASTLNAGGGAVALVNDVGAGLVADDVPAGGIFTATYIASANKFYITGLVASQALSKSGGDMTGPVGAKIIIETKTAPAIAAGALTLDLSAGSVFDVALNGAITALTLSNPPASGRAIGFTLIFTADGTARAVTWPASIKWPGGIAPTLTSVNGKKDFFSFYTQDAGSTYQAFIAGQNL